MTVNNFEERLLLPKNLCAKAFGVSVQAFDRWEVEPAEKRGREQLYYLPDVIEFRLNRDTKGTLDLQAERARLACAQANKTEIEVNILKGRVYRAEKVERAWTEMIANCRARLVVIPTRLAPIVSAEDDQKKNEVSLRDAVYDALNELKNYEPTHYTDTAAEVSDADDSAASETDSKPMG